jgi:hypothetical protein
VAALHYLIVALIVALPEIRGNDEMQGLTQRFDWAEAKNKLRPSVPETNDSLLVRHNDGIIGFRDYLMRKPRLLIFIPHRLASPKAW